MRNPFKNWKSCFLPTAMFIVGLPGTHDDLAAWQSQFVMIPEHIRWFLIGGGTTWLFLFIAIKTWDHWPTIKRFFQKASPPWNVKDTKFRIMHFGTVYGDMTVHFSDDEKAIDDINAWLDKNDLRAPVSSKKIRDVLERNIGAKGDQS